MSHLTLAMIASLFAGTVQAGQALEDAQAKRGKAFNDFYNNYKASQHRPEDAQAIGNQTIAPSTSQVTRALAQEQVQAIKGAGVQSMTQAEADAAHAQMRKQAEEDAQNGVANSAQDGDGTADGKPGAKTAAESGANGGSGALAGGQGGYAGPRKPTAPETVIDGKAIPKEITFGDKK